MSNTVNKSLLNSILRKRQNSEQLNNEEEAYARKVFDEMMESKKQVRKVVRIVTGEQLRKENDGEIKKGKVDAEATRKDPRYPQGKNPQTIKGENTDPDVNSLKAKIPDADEKSKTGPRYEQDRLAEMTQEAVPPRSEATAKFVPLDPVIAGDIVSKNMLKTGTRIIKGIVLKVKNDVAFVKWADGRTMYEHAHLLVKVKKSDAAVAADEVKEDPKLGPSDKEEDDKNTPMSKQSLRVRGRKAARNIAARRRRGPYPSRVQDPTTHRIGTSSRAETHIGRRMMHEGARHGILGSGGRKSPVGSAPKRIMSQARRSRVKKDGDIAVAPDYSTPGQMKTTPFQDLTNSLQDVVRLAGQLKEKQDRTSDQDIKNHYEELIGQLREIAEKILSGLNAELDEAKSDE